MIATGPYRFVRHPAYAGALVMIIGAGFVEGNWVGLLFLTVLLAVPLLYRIHVEEDTLLTEMGERYGEYAWTHKRLIPFIW